MKRFFLPLFLLFAIPAFAGGPWYVDTATNSGVPARWPYDQTSGKWVMEWWLDPGTLPWGQGHALSADQAKRDVIDPILSDWQSVQLPYKSENGTDLVQTTAIEFSFKGKLTRDYGRDITDITVDNYSRYAFPDPMRPPKTVVIFDSDGSIIEDYCERNGNSVDACHGVSGGTCGDETHPAGWRNCIAGMGNPALKDSSSKIITQGFIILNGRLIDGISAPDNGEMTTDQFKAVIKHEFGHLFNLDHSQINAEASESCDGDNCDGAQGIVTMFPALKTVAQSTLHRDDKVAISWLYPTQDFQDKFCVITGEVKDKDDKGMQGVNVIARNVNDPTIDARSMVSGVLYAPHTDDGHYFLSGIIPGETYEVLYEELIKKYNEREGSGFAPLENESPTGFGNGKISGPDGGATIHCDHGGDTITMTTLKIDVSQGKAISGALDATTGGEDGGTSGEKKGWCALNPNQPFDGLWGGVWGSGIALLVFLRRKQA